MRTSKIIAIAAVLIAALITTIVRLGSDGLARGGLFADRTTNSPQHFQRISPVADPVAARKPDIGNIPEMEPWGPFRTTDW
jgi:hypothetical protein